MLKLCQGQWYNMFWLRLVNRLSKNVWLDLSLQNQVMQTLRVWFGFFIFFYILVQLQDIFLQQEETRTPCRTGNSHVLFVWVLTQSSKLRLEEILVSNT